jgi:hypothetical protein
MAIAKTIDIDNEPQLIELVSALRDEQSSVLLRLAGEEVAIVTPVTGAAHHTPNRRVKTAEDLAEFLSLAGTWKGLVDEDIVDEIYRSRSISTRNPVDLLNPE